MKYILIVTTFIVLLGVGSRSVAAEENEVVHTYDQQWQGMGVGGLVGALVGGPPGFIVGIASGALIGHQKGQEDDLTNAHQEVIELTKVQHKLLGDLQTAQNEIIALRQNIEQGKGSKNKQVSMLKKADQQYVDQLAAIANGFVLNIQFRTESAELVSHFKQQLTRVMGLLDAFPELAVHINGYADQRGTEKFNHLLSQQRVDVVAHYLQAAGIAVNRIRKVPHGERQAQHPESDVEGMSFDRRVVLYFRRKLS